MGGLAPPPWYLKDWESYKFQCFETAQWQMFLVIRASREPFPYTSN